MKRILLLVLAALSIAAQQPLGGSQVQASYSARGPIPFALASLPERLERWSIAAKRTSLDVLQLWHRADDLAEKAIGDHERVAVDLDAVASVAFHAAIVAQQPPQQLPPPGERMPEGYHCKRPEVTIAKGERAVHCDCKYSCSMNPDGSVSEHEDPSCDAYCHEKNQVCTCHVEEPCAGAMHGNALMDMDGHVVAVARRKP